jgi:hypothetical protein
MTSAKPPDKKLVVKMGQPVRVRLDREMGEALRDHARRLSAAAGKALDLSAAIRDVLGRGLATPADEAQAHAFGSGFREGFLRAHHEIRTRMSAALDESPALPAAATSRAPKPVPIAAAKDRPRGGRQQQ